MGQLKAQSGSVTVQATITNVGASDGDEIAQVYVALPDQPMKERVPVSSLCGFQKVHLKKGESSHVTFHVEGSPLQVVKDDGSRKPATGVATFFVGGLSPGGTSSTSSIISGKVELIQSVFDDVVV